MLLFDINKSFVVIVCLSFLSVFQTFEVNAGDKWGCVHTVRYTLDGTSGGAININSPETFEWLSDTKIKVKILTYEAFGGDKGAKHFVNGIGSVFINKDSYPYTVVIAEPGVGSSFRVDYLKCKP